ncbi:MAG: hypothetical protein WD397_04365 [Wenzhouxiangellaceae bacterium]
MTIRIHHALRALAILLACLVAVSVIAQSSPHAHEAADELELKLDEGKRWSTDASLRTGMMQIREAFDQKLPGFRDGSLATEDYEALADVLDDQLRFMFENCDLPPAADAQLHRLLAFIAGATNGLREQGRRDAAMASLHRSLDAYATYFDHPG